MKYFIAIVIFTCSSSCSNNPGRASDSSTTIAIKFLPLPKVVSIGDVIPVRIEVRNVSNKIQSIAAPSHIQLASSFKFVLHPSDSLPSAKLGDYAIFTDTISTITALDSIAPGEARIYKFEWEAKQIGIGYLVMNPLDLSFILPDPIRLNIKSTDDNSGAEKSAQ